MRFLDNMADLKIRHIVAGIAVNDKHEFTQSWKTASDWSAVDEWNWLIELADVRGGENSWRNP